MPMPVGSLTPTSTDDEIKRAVAETISQLVSEGMEQSQAVAMAHEMARRATGKDVSLLTSPSVRRV